MLPSQQSRTHYKRVKFNLNNGLKSAFFNFVEQVLGEVVRTGRAHTVFKAVMRLFVRTNAGGHTIVRSVLSSTVLLVPIVQTDRRMMDRAGDENLVHDIREASTTVPDNESSGEPSLTHAAMLAKILHDSESHKEPFWSHRRHHCSAGYIRSRKSVSKELYLI